MRRPPAADSSRSTVRWSWRRTGAWAIAAAAVAAVALASATLWPRAAKASDDPTISAVQYNREVVRILQRKCVACHVKNGQAMPLDTFREVAPWSRAIREEILEHRMPPWPAADGIRPFANDPSLTTREVALLLAWLDGAMPRGDEADLPATSPVAEWPAGPPDDIVALAPQSITTDGTTVVRRVDAAVRGAAPRWLRGFDVAPGERSALRAAFVFLQASDGSEQWLGTWTPWHAMATAPAGSAYAVPPEASLVVELHYNAWDEPARALTDRSRLGLYFDAAPPAAPLRPLRVAAAPGGVGAERVARGAVTLAKDARVWALRPRLQRSGTAVDGSLEVIATRPDGSVEPLLWLRENSPDWQFGYVLRDAVALPRGSRLRLVARAADPGAGPVEASVDVTWLAAPTVGATTSDALRP